MIDPYGPLNTLINAVVLAILCCSGLIVATVVEWLRGRRTKETVR